MTFYPIKSILYESEEDSEEEDEEVFANEKEKNSSDLDYNIIVPVKQLKLLINRRISTLSS